MLICLVRPCARAGKAWLGLATIIAENGYCVGQATVIRNRCSFAWSARARALGTFGNEMLAEAHRSHLSSICIEIVPSALAVV